MGDKKTISVRKLAALERARALGLTANRPGISALESEAREWKLRSDVRSPTSEVQGPGSEVGSRKSEIGSQSSEVGSPRSEVRGRKSEVQVEKHDQASSIKHLASSIKHPVSSIKHPVSSMNEGFDWKPYQSEHGEGKKKAKRKAKSLNTASIACLARKIMAKEWAMALGRSRSLGSEQSTIERGAERFRQKKKEERERKDVGEKRARRQRVSLEAALRNFGRNLVEASKPVTPETAETLLEAAITDTGEFISITWQEEDGCRILIEPWEEKRLRRKSGENVPAVFQATVDDNLMLSSYERVENPELLQQTQNDLILKNILSSFRKSPQKDFHAFEDAVAERGRIIQSTKMNGGWKTHFEPWHEVRIRNIERGGQPPIITYIIKTDKDFEHITCARGQ